MTDADVLIRPQQRGYVRLAAGETKALATPESPAGIAKALAASLEHFGKRKQHADDLEALAAQFETIDEKALRRVLNAAGLQLVVIQSFEALPAGSAAAPRDPGTLLGRFE